MIIMMMIMNGALSEVAGQREYFGHQSDFVSTNICHLVMMVMMMMFAMMMLILMMLMIFISTDIFLNCD